MRTNEGNKEMEEGEKSIPQEIDEGSREASKQKSRKEVSRKKEKAMTDELEIDEIEVPKKRKPKQELPVYLCGNCDAPVRKGQKFCHSCGHQLNWHEIG